MEEGRGVTFLLPVALVLSFAKSGKGGALLLLLLYIIKLMEPMAMKLKKYMCVVPPTTGSKFFLQCPVVSFSLGLLPIPPYSSINPPACLHSIHLSSSLSSHPPPSITSSSSLSSSSSPLLPLPEHSGSTKLPK